MALIRLVLTVTLLATLTGCSESQPAKDEGKWHRIIIYFDGDRQLQLDYEGTGYRQQSYAANGEVSLTAIHLDHWTNENVQDPKYVDASFEGKISSSGAIGDSVSIDLAITNTVPLELRFLGMNLEETEEDRQEGVTFKYAAGQHSLRAKGNISSLFEKER